MESKNALLRLLPKVDEAVRALGPKTEGVPALLVKQAVQEQIALFRAGVLAGEVTRLSRDDVMDAAMGQLRRTSRSHLRGLINATGVILHTNLGRSRLSRGALEHLAAVATGYSNLEYDLDAGERGSRYSHVEGLLRQLTGAEDALVVNNNAAAVLLVLDTLAKGREAIVSRGELVEIGGAFRVPDVMERSGCRMVEVGTTNKTHPADYERAITEETGALLKVHTSNYRIVGFTQEVPLADLHAMGQQHNIPVLYDLGSGLLYPLRDKGISGEPTVAQCVPYADVLSFSGDKLLGGPQAGIIVGKREYIAPMKKNALLRALRIDKLTLAALEHTLRQYLSPDSVEQNIPTLSMITAPVEEVEEKARRLAGLLNTAQLSVEIVKTSAQIGGGSLPDVSLPSCAVAVRAATLSAGGLEQKLRESDPPVIGRIEQERLLLDVRTVDADEIPQIAQVLNNIG